MVLDIEGTINSIDVAEQLNSDALIEVHPREEGYTITINSIDSHPISLIECMSLISYEYSGDIEFTDKSFVIDENMKLRRLDLSLEISNPRSSNEEGDLDLMSLEVINDHVFITQKDKEMAEFSLYTYEGALVYSQEITSEYSDIDLSDYFNRYSYGKLFFIVGRKNGKVSVQKLIR